ncbi:uncharacterized protein LOC127118898 isoform X1 [Lathyrus oleraceus]|uniref:Uncharacterized protein n=3 Tax=Pisum sativum TaxID=3888 RepID=A0A9D4YBN8_PEA|nr:uncharacterized protein LOC127118898 isoform X1 [Pisum sativum]KAI5435987.1 hypothetical protein KIW84_022425 [Pisum sativum]
MASPFGWYGPLIDLCNASHHIGEFVQLLVFVHRCFPVQYKSSKSGKDLTRIDIQVGDDTMPYFGVSLWQNQMGSMVSAGDVVLLQNFMITKYGGVVEAKTVQWSSLFCLVHPFHSLISKDVEEMVAGCRIGTATKEKLSRVIKWVRQSRTTICNIKLQSTQKIEYLPRNWTVLEERVPKDCYSLIEVSQLTTSCKTIVLASICEIVPLRNVKTSVDTVKEKIFLSKRVCKAKDNNLVEDLLCTGCQLCGSPLGSESVQNAFPLVCSKSSSRLHAVCSIYRPFMLYVWDESYFMPVLVKNKAAEILFGNIKAENVYSSYREQKLNQNPGTKNISKEKEADEILSNNPRLSREGLPSASSLEKCKSLQLEEKHLSTKPFNFYHVWLIFLKLLLKQGKNSPLKFEILVDPYIDVENGKFEMVSATLPCFGTN